jgi:hypothetical protein
MSYIWLGRCVGRCGWSPAASGDAPHTGAGAPAGASAGEVALQEQLDPVLDGGPARAQAAWPGSEKAFLAGKEHGHMAAGRQQCRPSQVLADPVVSGCLHLNKQLMT